MVRLVWWLRDESAVGSANPSTPANWRDFRLEDPFARGSIPLSPFPCHSLIALTILLLRNRGKGMKKPRISGCFASGRVTSCRRPNCLQMPKLPLNGAFMGTVVSVLAPPKSMLTRLKMSLWSTTCRSWCSRQICWRLWPRANSIRQLHRREVINDYSALSVHMAAARYRAGAGGGRQRAVECAVKLVHSGACGK